MKASLNISLSHACPSPAASCILSKRAGQQFQCPVSPPTCHAQLKLFQQIIVFIFFLPWIWPQLDSITLPHPPVPGPYCFTYQCPGVWGEGEEGGENYQTRGRISIQIQAGEPLVLTPDNNKKTLQKLSVWLVWQIDIVTLAYFLSRMMVKELPLGLDEVYTGNK